MWGVHTAGTEETDGHGYAVTDESGEVGRRGCDGMSAFASGNTGGGVEEVESVL